MNNQDTEIVIHEIEMGIGGKILEYVLPETARKLKRERDELREAIRETLMENLHLADGDICTLKRLKDAIGFDLPETKIKP